MSRNTVVGLTGMCQSDNSYNPSSNSPLGTLRIEGGDLKKHRSKKTGNAGDSGLPQSAAPQELAEDRRPDQGVKLGLGRRASGDRKRRYEHRQAAENCVSHLRSPCWQRTSPANVQALCHQAFPRRSQPMDEGNHFRFVAKSRRLSLVDDTRESSPHTSSVAGCRLPSQRAVRRCMNIFHASRRKGSARQVVAGLTARWKPIMP